MAEELTFRLEDFEGPLELLLTLVQKHKMDLHNIPILELIDQYTRTVEAAQAVDPDISSSFIEMAAHLVEMKSYLLLPRSTEGERMKQELTGQLIEYDQCRRMAARLRERGEEYTVFVRTPARLEWDNTYDLFHSPQVLADCWQALMGAQRSLPVRPAIFAAASAATRAAPMPSRTASSCPACSMPKMAMRTAAASSLPHRKRRWLFWAAALPAWKLPVWQPCAVTM